jgi:hypothetical protein
MNTPEKAKPEKEKDVLLVLDRTARSLDVPRRHDVLLDNDHVVTYAFLENQKVEMPAAHAIRLGNADRNFEVYREDGSRLDVHATATKPAEGQLPPPIPRGCCIAKFEELSVDSLVIRAVALKGGMGLSKRNGKEALVNFLTEATAQPEPIVEKDGVGDAEAEDLGDADLKKLWEEDEAA